MSEECMLEDCLRCMCSFPISLIRVALFRVFHTYFVSRFNGCCFSQIKKCSTGFVPTSSPLSFRLLTISLVAIIRVSMNIWFQIWYMSRLYDWSVRELSLARGVISTRSSFSGRSTDWDDTLPWLVLFRDWDIDHVSMPKKEILSHRWLLAWNCPRKRVSEIEKCQEKSNNTLQPL